MLFYCIYFFVIGAFLGWILECVFKAITRRTNNAPGILYGPFCILYGIGAVILATIIPRVTDNFWLSFTLSAILLTFCEYVTYILLKKMYGIALWNYSNMRLAISEKICVEYAIAWGILGALFIKFLLPILSSVFLLLNTQLLYLVLFSLFIFISLDLLYTNDRLIRKYM